MESTHTDDASDIIKAGFPLWASGVGNDAIRCMSTFLFCIANNFNNARGI